MPPRRYLTLDHWRGLACLAVLVNHSVWSRTGTATEQLLFDVAQRLWMGVPIFFVISGYCISATVDSHRANTNRPLRTYFTRRLRRIYPPYWAVLAATLLIVAAVDVLVAGAPLSASGEFLRPWWYDPGQWIGNVSLTETWRSHVLPGQKALMLSHAWTLCYEEQFYVVAGLLLWLVPARFFAGTLVVTAGTALATLVFAPAAIEGFFFDGSWFQFWFGVLVYQTMGRSRAVRGAAVALFLAVAFAAGLHWHRLLEVEKNVPQALFVASLFAAALIGLARYDGALARVRALRPLQICGLMCYSLYLVHLPVVKFLRASLATFDWHPTPYVSALIAMPIAIAVAWGFHRTVERRFLNAKAPAATLPLAVPADVRPA